MKQIEEIVYRINFLKFLIEIHKATERHCNELKELENDYPELFI